MKQITMLELKKHADQLGKEEVVLDVRTTEEYAEGHVPGSINIPHDQVGTAQALVKLRGYKTIFMHCRSGGRVQHAASVLQASGIANLVCIAGSGMPDWISAGYPVEKGSSR